VAGRGRVWPAILIVMSERSEVSIHEVKVFRALQASDGWVSNRELSDGILGVAYRTVRAHTMKLVRAGIADQADVFPAHKYRLSKLAGKRNAAYMNDTQLIQEIQTATSELETAREVVRNLANDLASVADVIEPVLMDHATRIRRARMTTVDEVRQSISALKEHRDFLLDKKTAEAVKIGNQLIDVCQRLEEFRMCGFLDAYLKAVVEVSR
jgi:DNA-binding transcriptional ArsR family regulator